MNKVLDVVVSSVAGDTGKDAKMASEMRRVNTNVLEIEKYHKVESILLIYQRTRRQGGPAMVSQRTNRCQSVHRVC